MLRHGAAAKTSPGAPLPAGTKPAASIIPAGSTVLAQVNGGSTPPALVIGKTRLPFDRVEGETYHLETDLTAGDRLVIERNKRQIAGWAVKIVSDRAPRIEFSAAAETDRQLRLRLPFKAADDYGLKTVTASIRRLDGVAMPGGADEVILRLPLPGLDAKLVKGKSTHNLVSHVWAGLPVLVHLLASDEQGQTGVSGDEPVVLPERRFNHPLAKEIYELRKGLTARPRDRALGVGKLVQLTEDLALAQAAADRATNQIPGPGPGLTLIRRSIWCSASPANGCAGTGGRWR